MSSDGASSLLALVTAPLVTASLALALFCLSSLLFCSRAGLLLLLLLAVVAAVRVSVIVSSANSSMMHSVAEDKPERIIEL
jgi:hypothetical protein